MPRYVEHVTLTTGHTRRSSRDEVDRVTIDLLRPLIDRVVAGERVAIPAPLPGYTLTGAAEWQCLLATVWAPHPQGPNPVATIGVALRSKDGAKLWRMMHDDDIAPIVTDRERPPPEPWVAVKLYPGLNLALDAAQWLGDFERCLAWAWLVRSESASLAAVPKRGV